MTFDYPPEWLPGQLLDLKRFTDGSFRATLLGEVYDPKEPDRVPSMAFDSTFAAQSFVSWWYSSAKLREA